jgi:hypothetical protein
MNFYGTTGDIGINHTVLAERIYSGTEKSEMILFKGNDASGTAGPDRIRLRAAEFRIQTYTSTEDYSTLADNNDRLTILNNGNIGIGMSTPSYQLELASGGTGINTSALKFDGVTFNQDYYINITTGSGDALKALIPNSNKDISGLRNLSITGAFIASTSISSPLITCNSITGDNGAGSSILNLNYSTLNINGTSMTATAAELNFNDITTLGAFQASKVMTLDSNGIGLFGLGSTTSNALKFYGGTANKEAIYVFRSSDDSGLTIASRPSTTQKCSPLLHLYSNYNETGVIGTGNAEYKEVIRSNHKLVGFADNYQSGWFHGYLGGTPPWKPSGFIYATQFYTSMEALNICCNSSTVSSITSGANLLLTNNGQLCLNTTTPQSGYQFTMNGSSSYNGIRMNGTNTMLYLQNLNTSTTDRTEIILAGNSATWQFGGGNSGHGTAPNGLYWYNGSYRMLLSSSGRLSVNTTSQTGQFEVRGSNTIGRFSDGTCDCDIWCNTGGLFGRRCFFGTSTADDLTIQTNNTERMTFTSGGQIGIGTATPLYPLHVANTRGGQEGSQSYYYYLGPGQSNGSTTTTPSNISIRSNGRLLVNSEIDVISDFRKKENITILDNTYCNNFVKNITPKKFNYKSDPNGTLCGYIAQDLIKNNFGELIMVEVDPESQEYTDEDGFVSEAGKTYTLSRSQIIAILHNSLKQALDKLEALEDKVYKMENNL